MKTFMLYQDLGIYIASSLDFIVRDELIITNSFTKIKIL